MYIKTRSLNYKYSTEIKLYKDAIALIIQLKLYEENRPIKLIVTLVGDQ